MKKFQANNHQQASKQLDAIADGLSKNLPETVNHQDRFHYHVAMVRIDNRPGEAKNDVSFNVQQFHGRGFDKMKKNIQFLGFTQAVILHDPTQVEEEKGTAKPVHQLKTESKTREEIRKEIEAENEEEIERRVQERLEAGKDTDDTNGSDDTGNDDGDDVKAIGQDVVKSGTVEDLDAYANDYGVEPYDLSSNKDGKREAIQAWLNIEA